MEIPVEIETVVLYHHSSPDAMLATWAVSLVLDNHTTIYLKSSRFWEPPKLANKRVIFVDFTFQPVLMLKLLQEVESMMIIDHNVMNLKFTHSQPAGTNQRVYNELIANPKLTMQFNNQLTCAQIAWDYAKNILCNNMHRFMVQHVPAAFSDIPCGNYSADYKTRILSFIINAKSKTYRPWFINVLSDVSLWKQIDSDSNETIKKICSTGAYSNINSFYKLLEFNEDELENHIKYMSAIQQNNVANLSYVARVQMFSVN